MKLNHEIIDAGWDETNAVWNIRVKNLITNEVFVDQAEILINGGGVLKQVTPRIESYVANRLTDLQQLEVAGD